MTNLPALTLVPKDYDWIVGYTNGGLTIHACVGDLKEYFADTPAPFKCIRPEDEIAAIIRSRMDKKD